MTRRTAHAIVLAALLLIVALPVNGGCEPYPVSPDSPTGVVGCTVYGEGTASMYAGPGIARNDCVYPWTACQPIAIQSLDTGVTIIVTPSMYCDCYLGDGYAANDRIVDLDPAAVAALGLDPARGLWSVTVEPFHEGTGVLPDTATEAP